MIKNVSKIDPPLKRAKCHLNDQNRQFVKSEPPGPALFEFQGVPRDPILRPKSDPLILNVKKWHHFMILAFCVFMIFMFYHFLCFVEVTFFDHFDVLCCYCNKALWQLLFIGGSMMMMWWFSPHDVQVGYLHRGLSSCRGDHTGEEIFIITLVLPSVDFPGLFLKQFMSGRFTGEELWCITLVLPSLFFPVLVYV